MLGGALLKPKKEELLVELNPRGLMFIIRPGEEEQRKGTMFVYPL